MSKSGGGWAGRRADMADEIVAWRQGQARLAMRTRKRRRRGTGRQAIQQAMRSAAEPSRRDS